MDTPIMVTPTASCKLLPGRPLLRFGSGFCVRAGIPCKKHKGFIHTLQWKGRMHPYPDGARLRATRELLKLLLLAAHAPLSRRSQVAASVANPGGHGGRDRVNR